MKSRLVSFDIWDTCLVRSTGTPRTIFRAAAAQTHPGASPERIEELVANRIAAEINARKTAKHGECTLAEIEHSLAAVLGDSEAKAMIEAETQLERASVRPVAATLTEVQRARDTGARIAFASDMYLPEAFLRELLESHGFARPGDRVFVSGDRRANKHSGRLYGLMREELDANGLEWIHLGDNPRADIAAARQHGIRAVEIRSADWTDAEKIVLGAGRPQSERIAAAMRSVRVGMDPSIPAARRDFLAGVAAPWLVAFTTRTIALARELGAQRIYFVARDGDIPNRIASILHPAGIDCRYLPGSRKAWCYPATLDLSEPSTSWLRLAPMRPDTLLASLGLNFEERGAILGRCGISPDTERRFSQEELQPVWAELQSGGFGDKIVTRAAAARESCLAFLRDAGLFDDVPWTLADVGWSLHGQAALGRIMESTGAKQVPKGVYFMMRHDRRPESETGPARAWIIGDDNHAPGSTSDLLGWMSPVIEECFLTSADPGVAGYAIDGNQAAPVHTSSTPTEDTIRHAAELRTSSDALAKELAADLRDTTFTEAFEESALAGLLRFLREPAEHEAEVLQGLRHATAPGASSNESQPLVRAYSLGDALGLLLRRAGLKQSRPEHGPYWHSGSMAVSPRLARAGMKAALAPNPLKRLLGRSR